MFRIQKDLLSIMLPKGRANLVKREQNSIGSITPLHSCRSVSSIWKEGGMFSLRACADGPVACKSLISGLGSPCLTSWHGLVTWVLIDSLFSLSRYIIILHLRCLLTFTHRVFTKVDSFPLDKHASWAGGWSWMLWISPEARVKNGPIHKLRDISGSCNLSRPPCQPALLAVACAIPWSASMIQNESFSEKGWRVCFRPLW